MVVQPLAPGSCSSLHRCQGLVAPRELQQWPGDVQGGGEQQQHLPARGMGGLDPPRRCGEHRASSARGALRGRGAAVGGSGGDPAQPEAPSPAAPRVPRAGTPCPRAPCHPAAGLPMAAGRCSRSVTEVPTMADLAGSSRFNGWSHAPAG